MDDNFKDQEPEHEPKANVPTQLIDPFELYLQREQAEEAVFFDGDYANFNGPRRSKSDIKKS